MATFQDGGRKRATANTVSAMRRRAERRQCPECGRKSAIISERDDWGDRLVLISVCRWKDSGLCGFTRVVDL